MTIQNVKSIIMYIAYESPKVAKEHETCTICRVPSQSKFIAKYFPYKESEILLFEAVHGTRMMTQTTMSFLESLCTTDDSVSIVNAFSSYRVQLSLLQLLAAHHRILSHTRFLS